MPAAKKHSTELRSSCPIGAALDLLGDRWTLIIVRDLLRGLTRYGEFVSSGEGIPTNILAARLVRLEECGIVTSTPYQQNPVRYRYTLTPRGLALKPVLGALGMWGATHVAGTKIPPELAALLGDAKN